MAKMFLFGILLLALAFSPSRQQRSRGNFQASGNEYASDKGPPQPYHFGYNSEIEFGSNSYHEEESDGTGKVRGRYGYKNADGLYRAVEYEADANGYRATIRSNEPGIEQKNPADVTLRVEPAPKLVVHEGITVVLPLFTPHEVMALREIAPYSIPAPPS